MKFKDKITGNVLVPGDPMVLEQYKAFADRYKPIGDAPTNRAKRPKKQEGNDSEETPEAGG